MSQAPLITKSGLRIGCAYTPNTHPYHDEDALRLQDALLGNRRSLDDSGIAIAAFVVVVVLVSVIHHFTR